MSNRAGSKVFDILRSVDRVKFARAKRIPMPMSPYQVFHMQNVAEFKGRKPMRKGRKVYVDMKVAFNNLYNKNSYILESERSHGDFERRISREMWKYPTK